MPEVDCGSIASVHAGSGNGTDLHHRPFNPLCQPVSLGFTGFLRYWIPFWSILWEFAGAGRRLPLEERLFRPGTEWRVEEVDEGRGGLEAAEDVLDEGGPGCAVGGERGGETPLAVEEEIDGGMIGRETFGGAGELEAVGLAQEGAEFSVCEELAELGVMFGDMAAHGEELVALGHEDAGGDGEAGAADGEIEASAGGLGEAFAGPPGGDVDLVRALVFGEADVAVDAHEGLLRRADVEGGEGGEMFVELGDEGEHGKFEFALVEGPAGFKPGAVVVAFEGAEEFQRFGGEMRGHGSRVYRRGLGEAGAVGPVLCSPMLLATLRMDFMDDGMGDGIDQRETIVAVATPAGRGGIGVVRLSGPAALRIVGPLLRLGRPLAAGRARFAEILDVGMEVRPRAGLEPGSDVGSDAGSDAESGQVLDEAVVTYFQAPRSYTGEDVVEIAAHGAPVLLAYLLRQCCAGGARLAQAGEFTERAFLAGRIDLMQAEAVGDLIEAGTLEQARVAARQLGGGLSRAVAPVKEGLVLLIAGLEAGIDFAEDDISILPDDQILLRIADVEAPLKKLERSFAYGRVVREGFQLALVGRPNAGKSSLFNRLLERERAIVTAAPGTTRDPIAEWISLGGIPVELVDTAGLRGSSAGASGGLDEAELMGIAKSREAMAEAAVVLLVVDATVPLDEEDIAVLRGADRRTLLVVLNKVDLVAEDADSAAALSLQAMGPMGLPEGAAAVFGMERTSALTGEGVGELRQRILGLLEGSGQENSSAMVTNLRQHQAIVEALRALAAGGGAIMARIPHEMVLLDLYEALRALDSLTGVTTSEDILRLIFGRFCIGK